MSSGTIAGSVLVARGSAQLTAQPTGGNALVLLAESETRFFIRDINLAVEFVRDAAGNVTEFVMVQGTSGARDAREVRSA